jgi:ribosome-associated protein
VSRLPTEIVVTDRVRVPGRELSLAYARSGGPGGQHVNRTETKVLLRWNPSRSGALDEADRAWVERRLAARLTSEGDLLVASETHRDQSRNVADALERFVRVLREALHRPKPRKRTKPSRGARERRLDAKRRTSGRKASRRHRGED